MRSETYMSKINLQRGKLLSSYMYVLIIFTPPPIRQRSTAISVSVCLCVCLCAIIPLQLHVRSSPNIFVRVTYGRGSVLLWRRSDMLRISGFMNDVIFAYKLRLLDVAARLRPWGSHAALAFARRNTHCRQQVTLQVATQGAESAVYDCLVHCWKTSRHKYIQHMYT